MESEQEENNDAGSLRFAPDTTHSRFPSALTFHKNQNTLSLLEVFAMTGALDGFSVLLTGGQLGCADNDCSSLRRK